MSCAAAMSGTLVPVESSSNVGIFGEPKWSGGLLLDSPLRLRCRL